MVGTPWFGAVRRATNALPACVATEGPMFSIRVCIAPPIVALRAGVFRL